MNRKLIITLNLLKESYLKNLRFFDLQYSPTTHFLSKFLLKEGFIEFFQVCQLSKFNNCSIIKIRLSYLSVTPVGNLVDYKGFKQTMPFKQFIFMSKPNKKITLSVKGIKKINVFNKVILMSSDVGFISGTEAIKRNIGGIYVGFFLI